MSFACSGYEAVLIRNKFYPGTFWKYFQILYFRHLYIIRLPICDYVKEKRNYLLSIITQLICESIYFRRTNCSSCISDKNECAWCEHTAQCFPFVAYIMKFSYGACTEWIDSMSLLGCRSCSDHMTCARCLSDFQCGWCSDVNNPTIGKCLNGDFSG